MLPCRSLGTCQFLLCLASILLTSYGRRVLATDIASQSHLRLADKASDCKQSPLSFFMRSSSSRQSHCRSAADEPHRDKPLVAVASFFLSLPSVAALSLALPLSSPAVRRFYNGGATRREPVLHHEDGQLESSTVRWFEDLYNAQGSRFQAVALPKEPTRVQWASWDGGSTTNSKYAMHDAVVLRKSQIQSGYLTRVPQAARYTTRDWWRIMAKTSSSTVLKAIREPVIANVLWAIAIAVFHGFSGFPAKAHSQAHGLLGSALGLLLVFRTNAAYQRFGEGRKIWDGILSDIRSLSRYCMIYRNELGERRAKRVDDLARIYASLLSEHLGVACRSNYFNFLKREDIVQLESINNRPLHILNMLAAEIRDIPDQTRNGQITFSSRERATLLGIADKLGKAVGACERLVQTPVPLNYARHTARFLAFWCLSLPLALVGGLGAAVVPVMLLVTWGLYGIQEIGLMIEEPFSSPLNMDVMVKTIYDDVLETAHVPQWQAWGRKAAVMAAEMQD